MTNEPNKLYCLIDETGGVPFLTAYDEEGEEIEVLCAFHLRKTAEKVQGDNSGKKTYMLNDQMILMDRRVNDIQMKLIHDTIDFNRTLLAENRELRARVRQLEELATVDQTFH